MIKICNGVFDLTSEILNGRSVFRKRGGDEWLYFSADKVHWLINGTASKIANSKAAQGYASGPDEDLPPVSGWSLSDGKSGVADAGVTVVHSATLQSNVSCVYLCSCFLAMCRRPRNHV